MQWLLQMPKDLVVIGKFFSHETDINKDAALFLIAAYCDIIAVGSMRKITGINYFFNHFFLLILPSDEPSTC